MEHKIKRIVQRLLFSKIEPGLTMRGLAGEEPLVYKELILETIKPSELTLVDLTWSKERKAAGVTLRTIKEAMDERCNNRYLLYTLCLRGAPLVTTWDWLNRNIYDNTLTEFSKDKIFTSGYYGNWVSSLVRNILHQAMLSEFSLRTVVVTIECKVGETCTHYKETNSKSI